jgi:hypothetical protein
MGLGFEVHEYSIAALEQLIAEKSKNSSDVISKKFHRLYFKGYFDYIKARTIVVESEYVDRDYLEDFAGYYVRCFHPYDRTCTRLHFFNNLCQQLQQSYLGFVVVKPLPQTVIGRTCLVTYPTEGRRHFPITRSYNANLFGLDLKVETLAFQEQDKAVAACATSALWSVLQGTAMLFQHPILSPVEITKTATEHIPVESRTLPNTGLSPAMMARGIRGVSLEPFLVRVADEYVLRSTLYAYLRGKIPMILGVELFDVSDKRSQSIGLHAVAATGYSLGATRATPYGESNFVLRASRIDKIYVHDDQVGPFARMVIDSGKVKTPKGQRTSMVTSWRGKSGEYGSVRAVPEILLIPLYHKIRIPFDVVHDAVLSFDALVKTLSEQLKDGPGKKLAGKRFEWDIYLTTVNDLKRELLVKRSCGDSSLEDVLLQRMPHYMWRATASVDEKVMLDLLFDATDIELGQFFIMAIEYDREISSFIRTISKLEPIRVAYSARPIGKILDWFLSLALQE